MTFNLDLELMEDWASRLCERCGKPVDADWDYAWCDDCQGELCKHDNDPSDCNECMTESDLEYDARRER